MTGVVEPNEHDTFLLRQRIRPIVHQYEWRTLDRRLVPAMAVGLDALQAR